MLVLGKCVKLNVWLGLFMFIIILSGKFGMVLICEVIMLNFNLLL